MATNVLVETGVAEQRLAPMARRVGKCIVDYFVESEWCSELKKACGCWLLVTGYWLLEVATRAAGYLQGYLYQTCGNFSILSGHT